MTRYEQRDPVELTDDDLSLAHGGRMAGGDNYLGGAPAATTKVVPTRDGLISLEEVDDV